MQVGDVTKDGYFLSKTYSSMKPLTRILKIFAINSNIEPIRPKSYVIIKSFCTCFILTSLSLYCLYCKIKYVYHRMDVSIRLTDMVQVISDIFQYTVDLYFVYIYGRKMCVEYFKQYEKIDNFLSASCYSALKQKLMKIMTFFTIIWILSSLGDLGAWVLTFGWLIPVTHAISYVFLFIKMLTTLDLTAHVTHIEARLRMISNFVQSCYSCTEMCPVGQLSDCVRNRNWLYRDKDNAVPHTASKERVIDSLEIKRITKCYLLLTEQVMFINKMYGFRIILNTLNLLLDMVKILNLAIRIAVGTQVNVCYMLKLLDKFSISRTLYHSESYNYLPGVSGLMRFLMCASIIISMVYRCEQAYQQRVNVINIIDHLLINKNPDDNLRAAIVDLRTLLQDRPICFNMENFFTMNYPLLVSIASVVVTYTIILLQSVN